MAPTAPNVCVFAPAPILTVVIERGTGDAGELHIHPGGQGFWVARMLSHLGATTTLVTPLGGETGDVFGHLISDHGVDVRVVPVAEPTGAYVHDRRGGEREVWWQATLSPLGRHEMDDLYTATLGAALGAGVCVITGTHRQHAVLPDGTFTRLTADLGANDVVSLGDLQGDYLREALAGGVHTVKISEEELVEDGWAESAEDEAVLAGIERLVEEGATDVVVSRAEGGALARLDGRLLRAAGPEMTAIDPSGAGDSMTAALAFARAARLPPEETLRLAVGAGAMNVTRHGLGSGDAEAIEQLAANVEVDEIEASPR